MKKRLFLGLFVLVMPFQALSNEAETCDKVAMMPAVEGHISSYIWQGIDPDSEEVITRNYFIFDDGDQLIIENKYCTMNDYIIDYSSTKLDPARVERRIASFISRIQKKYNADIDTDFFQSAWDSEAELSEKFSVDTMNVEIESRKSYREDAILREQFFIYISIGGLA